MRGESRGWTVDGSLEKGLGSSSSGGNVGKRIALGETRPTRAQLSRHILPRVLSNSTSAGSAGDGHVVVDIPDGPTHRERRAGSRAAAAAPPMRRRDSRGKTVVSSRSSIGWAPLLSAPPIAAAEAAREGEHVTGDVKHSSRDARVR